MSQCKDTQHDSTYPINTQTSIYDITVIAQIDTLMGVDCLELAYRATQVFSQKKKTYKIQILGIEGGWDASLDSSSFFKINHQWLEQLSRDKRQGVATYRNWNQLNTEQHEEVLSSIVICCVKPGQLTKALLQKKGVEIHQMGLQGTPLEDLAVWLGEDLLSIDKAHSIYYKDYLPGLSVQGVPLNSSSHIHTPFGPLSRNTNSPPSVDKIVLRTQIFSQDPITVSGDSPEIDNFRIDDFWRGVSQNKIKGKSRAEKERVKSERDLCLYLVDEQSLTESDYTFSQYVAHFLDAVNYQHCMTHQPDGNDYISCSERHHSIRLPTSLVLFCHQGEENQNPFKRVEVIEFVTSNCDKQALEKLAMDPKLDGLAKVSVNSGQYTHYFCARIIHQPGTDSCTIVDYIVDNLMGVSLNGERPLVSYGSTFFLPFRQVHSKKNDTLSPKGSPFNYHNIIVANDEDVKTHQHRGMERFNLIANERDNFLYIDPVIRERLFRLEDGEMQRIEEWRADISPDDELTNACEKYIWSVIKTAPNRLSQCVRATVRSIKLYKFYNEVYILAVNVYEQFFDGQSSFTQNGNDWWHDLFTTDEQTLNTLERAEIKHWLMYTDKIRQLYPSFAERESDKQKGALAYFFGKASLFNQPLTNPEVNQQATPRTLNFEQLSKCHYDLPQDIEAIFAKLGIDKVCRLKPFIDNRMFINVAYGLAGDCKVNDMSKAKYEALFSLAAYVDDIDDSFSRLDGYAYDPEFVRALLDRQSYQRWRALGNLYAFTDYSNVYMGYGTEFNENIVPRHVFYNYQNMLLMGLFYRESLHDFSERISDVSKRIDIVSHQEFQTIREHFIRFTNVSWFQDLTSQVQGKEVYQKQLSGLNVQKEYEFLEKEVSSTYLHFQALTAETFTRLMFWLAFATLVGTAYELYGGKASETETYWWVPLLFLYFVSAWLLHKKIVNGLVVLGQSQVEMESETPLRLGARIKQKIRKTIAKLGTCFRTSSKVYWSVMALGGGIGFVLFTDIELRSVIVQLTELMESLFRKVK